jgi:hypothetical protein
MPRELSKGGQRPTVKLSVWSHGRQSARKKTREFDMAELVIFEPQNVSELKRFFEDNKDRVHEIWVVITKKTAVDQQPVSFNQALDEAKKHEGRLKKELDRTS